MGLYIPCISRYFQTIFLRLAPDFNSPDGVQSIQAIAKTRSEVQGSTHFLTGLWVVALFQSIFGQISVGIIFWTFKKALKKHTLLIPIDIP